MFYHLPLFLIHIKNERNQSFLAFQIIWHKQNPSVVVTMCVGETILDAFLNQSTGLSGEGNVPVYAYSAASRMSAFILRGGAILIVSALKPFGGTFLWEEILFSQFLDCFYLISSLPVGGSRGKALQGEVGGEALSTLIHRTPLPPPQGVPACICVHVFYKLFDLNKVLPS